MTNAVKISAVIITQNESENISRCIQSLEGLVDEILIVDSFSTDNTVEIAEKMGARIIQNHFIGHIQQKNFATGHAAHDLIISLDADEEISLTLKKSLIELFQSGKEIKAVKFNRMNFYLGKWIKYSGWYPDKKIRLFDRRVVYWGGTNPHDRIILQENFETIEVLGDLLHYSYKDYKSHLETIERYATISAQTKYDSGKSMNVIVHLVLYPAWVFINTYFLKKGFLDGAHGFLISRLNAYYRYKKYINLYRLYHSK